MNGGVARILERLESLGFRTRPGGMTPYGETMPLVSAVAWDTKTAQIALLAEMQPDTDLDEWRQLLFAAAGLRHNLAGDGPAAFGAPLILALTDDEGWRCLRNLAEDLVTNYVLFNRVDLNLIRLADLDNQERLDDALAPLLPSCRGMLDQEISRADVERFWAILRGEVSSAAADLDGIFTRYRDHAGEQLADLLIADDDQAPQLPSPFPLDRLTVRNFRSIREADVEFSPVTIVHGPNGGGKSSLLEAMELLWAGTSQRKPAEVSAAEYARYLPRNGVGDFTLGAEDVEVTDVSTSPRAELARNVLTHESVAALVSQSPEERYTALLATTGLTMPDLTARAKVLLDDAKRGADQALSAAGLPTLLRRDSRAAKHLRDNLKGGFASRLPATHDIVGAEEALAAISGATYKPRVWPRDEHAAAALLHADRVIAEQLEEPAGPGVVAEVLDDAHRQIASLVAPRREMLGPLRRLLELSGRPTAAAPALAAPIVETPMPVTQEIAIRWLNHAKALDAAAVGFKRDAEALNDVSWAGRLELYAAALKEAAQLAPTRDLEKFSRGARTSPSTPDRSLQPDDELYARAGFSSAPANPSEIRAAVEALAAALERQLEAMQQLQRDLESHPARNFHAHADTVLSAMCRFELARRMRNAGPILNASEKLVSDLLHTRLAPVVRELVASIVRFEWYFEPLLVPDQGRKVVLGGLATTQADLDARLLLNSAERTALGIAWFLALHLLQPAGRQRVLVLDDPISAFDAPNQAGLISTLRAYVRLTRPQQLVIATHDDPVAAMLAQEFAPVDRWPARSAGLRCQRDSRDCTVIRPEPAYTHSSNIEAEIEQLGLEESSALS
jgi:energy-coupling factor transporter ATP-binding protein EcfA2